MNIHSLKIDFKEKAEVHTYYREANGFDIIDSKHQRMSHTLAFDKLFLVNTFEFQIDSSVSSEQRQTIINLIESKQFKIEKSESGFVASL